MNTKLLLQVKAHILAEPKRLVMSSYKVIEGDKDPYIVDTYGHPRSFASCGMAACIAGWGGILRPKSIFHPSTYFEPRKMTEYADLFELTYRQAERLFDPPNWPKRFADGLRDDGSARTAEVAAARIDFFIATRGTDDPALEIKTKKGAADERELVATS